MFLFPLKSRPYYTCLIPFASVPRVSLYLIFGALCQGQHFKFAVVATCGKFDCLRIWTLRPSRFRSRYLTTCEFVN